MKKIVKKVRGKLTGTEKDRISDRLDKISDKVDNLSDKGKLTDSRENSLKKKISRAKSKLDVDTHHIALQNLIKKRIIRNLVDPMVDEISEIVRDEARIIEKVKGNLYKNKRFKKTMSVLLTSRVHQNKNS